MNAKRRRFGKFKISPALKINCEYFKSRQRRKCPNESYLYCLKECMQWNKNDKEGLRDKFWNYVEEAISNVYGKRSGSKRPYMYEHGCYIFTWGTTPIYIGQTTANKGFYEECFADHKYKKLKNFLSDRNNFLSSKKTKKSYLNLFLVFWDGRQDAILKDSVDHMETTLIMKAIEAGFYDDLLNEKKTSYKWIIEGYNDDVRTKRSSAKSGCIKAFKNVFEKHPRKK